ncbi:GAF domain-containing protein [Sulfobacillus sp. DSM 109850]|uniref:GAF domain-containing protein n=1 Tax=Sulfobacillus harzensis TaxID=2729629 RepID=A0A7Y0Q1M3_9FIRM|nr:GAF domain-containing protein [Sulfobacillus harzensis]
MEKLLSLTRRLTARRDMDSLLQELLDGSTALIPGADFVCVFLYRPDLNALVPVGGIGFDLGILSQIQLKPGESMTGKAFVEGRPLLLPSPEVIREAQANLSPDHDRAVRRAVGRPDNPVRSSLAVPMATDDRILGVLVIDNYDTDRDFTTVDLAVATSLADHAAVAVLNAEEYQAVQTLSQELQRTMTVQHRLLSSMMSSHGSLENLLRSLWRTIRRPFRLLEANGEVVAERGALAQPASFAVMAGQEHLGELQVSGPVHGFERLAVEQALPLIALEFLKEAARRQERLHAQAEAFRRIWDRDYGAVDALLQQYGLHQGHPRMALISGPPPTIVGRLTRMKDVPVMQRSQDLLLLVSDETWPRIRAMVDADTPVILGWPLDDSHDLRSEFAGLLLLLEAARRLGYPRLHGEVRLSEFPEMTLIAAVPGPVRRWFCDAVLSPLAGECELFETIKVWVFADRSYERTAAVMHTHPNTIRYRVDKARRRWGQPWDDRTAALLRWAFLAELDADL